MTMQIPASIVTGRGGKARDGGKGGRGGDVHFHYERASPLMDLPRAPYAAHNSGRENAPVPCLEGTCVAMLKDIQSWSESANGERPPVYWLPGLAGIGKSTIAKTAAEQAEKEGMLGATFFFSRSDEPLRDPRLVLSTLAFQLAHSDCTFKEAFKELVAKALRRDPTLGEKDLLSQLKELILNPLLNIDPPPHPVLIILDALDECEENGAAKILSLVFKYLTGIPFLRIFITSRPQPRLSAVFDQDPNLAKTIRRDIEQSVIRQDISLYISTELAKISQEFNRVVPTNWPTDVERKSLVEKCGGLFVYAATAIRFIGRDRPGDPHKHLRLILGIESLRRGRMLPYSHLDNLYMQVLRNSLAPDDDGEIQAKFQIVVGSIVVLREPLPLDSLANFIGYRRHAVEVGLRHLHSVIIPPSHVQAPRIYHPSFLEFITDASRCSMGGFVIVPQAQEPRHAIRCFELMETHLERDAARISDSSLLNREVDGFAEKVRRALLPEVQYACRYWASHLLCVEFGETKLMEALKGFSMRSILWWFEAMSLLGSVSSAVRSIEEAYRWAKSSKCESSVMKILSDSRRFILAHGEVIRGSALHVYHSALLFTPHDTVLYKTYCEDAKDSIKVLQGLESQWPQDLSTLHGHSDSVRMVVFSPDGSRLASGSNDHSVRLWDGISGASIAELEGHSDAVLTVAFSPDGSCLASGSYDHTVHLWDGVSGTSIAELRGHSDSVRMVAFSLDGSHLASGSDDHTVRLWDGISGACTAELKGHSNSVWAVAFSSDGLHLASGSDDCTICLWHGISGAFIRKLEGHSDLVRTVTFSPDGLHLASGSSDRTVQLWDVKDATKPITTLKGHSHSVLTIAFSPDGSCLASGSYGSPGVCLWDANSHASIAKLKGHSNSVWTLAFSPDGSCLASGSDDCTICLWDGKSGASIAKLKGHSDSVRMVAFSPDGSRIASGSADYTVRLWDGISNASITKQKGRSHSVLAAAFSPDGLYLALGSDDRIVRLWDAISCVPIEKLEGHSGQVYKVSFSFDGHTLISRALGETFTWDLTSRPPRRLPSGSRPATSHPSARSTLPIWSLRDRWVQVERQEDHQVRRICYIPPHYARSTFFVASSQRTHSRIAVGCEDGRVIILAIPGDPFNGDFSNNETLPAHDTRPTQQRRWSIIVNLLRHGCFR